MGFDVCLVYRLIAPFNDRLKLNVFISLLYE